jgi:hypothetical protein
MRLRLSKIEEIAHTRPPGYLRDVLSHGVVEGEFLEISPESLSALRDTYRPTAQATTIAPAHHPSRTPTPGPGTLLKQSLAKIGIHAAPGCQCNPRAALMDRNGPDWCNANIELIVTWLREESTRARLPFLAPAARLLIRRCIAKSRRLQPHCTPPAITTPPDSFPSNH